MILSFLKYCYFWIDSLEFLTQTFEPAPLPCMFIYGVPPGNILNEVFNIPNDFSMFGGTNLFIQYCFLSNHDINSPSPNSNLLLRHTMLDMDVSPQ